MIPGRAVVDHGESSRGTKRSASLMWPVLDVSGSFQGRRVMPSLIGAGATEGAAQRRLESLSQQQTQEGLERRVELSPEEFSKKINRSINRMDIPALARLIEVEIEKFSPNNIIKALSKLCNHPDTQLVTVQKLCKHALATIDFFSTEDLATTLEALNGEHPPRQEESIDACIKTISQKLTLKVNELDIESLSSLLSSLEALDGDVDTKCAIINRISDSMEKMPFAHYELLSEFAGQNDLVVSVSCLTDEKIGSLTCTELLNTLGVLMAFGMFSDTGSSRVIYNILENMGSKIDKFKPCELMDVARLLNEIHHPISIYYPFTEAVDIRIQELVRAINDRVLIEKDKFEPWEISRMSDYERFRLLSSL